MEFAISSSLNVTSSSEFSACAKAFGTTEDPVIYAWYLHYLLS